LEPPPPPLDWNHVIHGTVVNSDQRLRAYTYGAVAHFPGEIVLDPFVGTGTTCAVAKTMGRRYVGIDVNPAYVKIAQEHQLFGFLTTEPNDVVGAIHPKAMPVILTKKCLSR
jgi:hypothetical protein